MPMWDEQKSEISSGIGSEWGTVGPPHEGSMVKTGDDNTCTA